MSKRLICVSSVITTLIMILLLGCVKKQLESFRNPHPEGIPSFMIVGADSTVRELRNFDLPGALSASRGEHRINLFWKPDSEICAELFVGHLMAVGTRMETYIVTANGRVWAGGAYTSGDVNFGLMPILLDGIGPSCDQVFPSSQTYTVEIHAELYETKIGNADPFTLSKRSRKVLWSRTFRLEGV